ncbi:GntR family transcriptional regulator [Photobacterium sp.]|uniref:GntR family transcriptional regulator n=1 Tax=Photobacterium sp. TaxID=660 RepID=UPI00299F0A7B|nr:GntR family transcriptional regulator [Photobacterium sp.]MDX1301036.1 GntR family transcriptional regulator [Photobacterium sp.]
MKFSLSKHENPVSEVLRLAIRQKKLLPGSRLKEAELATAFNLSRTKIREALLQLAQQGLVHIEPNKGAVIPVFSEFEIQDVFWSRQVVERAIAERLVNTFTVEIAEKIQQHIMLEREAYDKGDRLELLQLSGDFHILLAELANVPLLKSFLRQLIDKNSLILSHYEIMEGINCSIVDHPKILAAFKTRQLEQVLAITDEHLSFIKDSIYEPLRSNQQGIADVLSQYLNP